MQKKKHYLLIRSLFSSGWTLALIWGKSSFYSACLLPETNSNVSREERSGFVCCWASLEHAAHVVIYIWTRGGRDRIRNNELDGTDWTSCWFHTDYFITECLFSIRLTSFQSRHFQLSIDITPMSVCWVFAELHFILVTYFKEQLAEMKTKSASCLFSFFPQNHKVLLYSWVYTKK